MLVGPGGQKYIFLSDRGATSTEALPPVTFSLADNGSELAPIGSPFLDGVTYQPANSGANDVFDAPAPAGPYSNAAPGGSDTFTFLFTNFKL